MCTKQIYSLIKNVLKNDNPDEIDLACSIVSYTIEKKLRTENRSEFMLDKTLARYFNKPVGTNMLYQNIRSNLNGRFEF